MRDKQIEEMATVINEMDDRNAHYYDQYMEECEAFADTNAIAKTLYDAGYRKASYVALETVDDFQNRLRHIFVDMCDGNDYKTVNLLEVDSAIENLFDIFVAELKKKYTEESK